MIRAGGGRFTARYFRIQSFVQLLIELQKRVEIEGHFVSLTFVPITSEHTHAETAGCRCDKTSICCGCRSSICSSGSHRTHVTFEKCGGA